MKKAPDAQELRIHEAEQNTHPTPTPTPTLKRFDYPLAASNPGVDIADYVRYTMKAHAETYAALDDHPETERAAAAALAWRHTLPVLDSTNAAKAFIACVAVGQSRQWITPEESRALMYTAQLALAALKGSR